MIKWRQRPVWCKVYCGQGLETSMKSWVQGKVAPVHGKKAYSGSRRTAPIILNFGTRWEIRRYPLNKRLGGPQKRSGPSGEAKSLLPMPGLEARAVQPVASPYAGYVTLAPLKTLAVKHNGLSPNSIGETEENIEK